MTDQIAIPTQLDSENEAPKRVSLEEYLEKYAHDHYEWDNGELIKMSPIRNRHNKLSKYLLHLFDAYFSYRPIGEIQFDPFLMRLNEIGVMREPDLQIILNNNPGQLTETAMIGPADICVEIVSPESVERDYGKRFSEYERARVKEYWLLDYLRKEARFHRLGENGLYSLHLPDADGNYESPLLPGLKLHAPTLWTETLPDLLTVVESVRAMLETAD